VVAHVQQGLDGQLEEAFRAAVAFGVSDELVVGVTLQAAQDGEISSSLRRRRCRISTRTMENPPSVSLPVNPKVRCEIQILTHDAGEELAPIEPFRGVEEPVPAHRLELQQDVLGVQEDQIHPAEPMAGEVGEQVQRVRPGAPRRGRTARSRSLSAWRRPSAAEPKR
jgi:hypothetical protein